MRFIIVVTALFAVLAACVSAYPQISGTCTVQGMVGPKSGHPKKFTPGSYKITAKKVSSGKNAVYKVTVSGQGPIKGLLLYATDAKSKARFGAFKMPQGFGPVKKCGGKNPNANTLSHTTPQPKNLPITFTWSSAGFNGIPKFQGIALKEFATFSQM